MQCINTELATIVPLRTYHSSGFCIMALESCWIVHTREVHCSIGESEAWSTFNDIP